MIRLIKTILSYFIRATLLAITLIAFFYVSFNAGWDLGFNAGYSEKVLNCNGFYVHHKTN